MAHEMTFFDAVKNRRTIYELDKHSPISDARIREILEIAVLDAPSTFNSQTTRIVVLLKDEHEKLWDMILGILQATVRKDHLTHTEEKMNTFKASYGTVLFFEDPEPTKQLQTKMPQYADRFPVWAQQTSAIHQYIIWTALTAEGLAGSLQHYNPVIDQKVKEAWHVPHEWALIAQMPFGKPVGGPHEKTFLPLDERLKIYGGDA